MASPPGDLKERGVEQRRGEEEAGVVHQEAQDLDGGQEHLNHELKIIIKKMNMDGPF